MPRPVRLSTVRRDATHACTLVIQQLVKPLAAIKARIQPILHGAFWSLRCAVFVQLGLHPAAEAVMTT